MNENIIPCDIILWKVEMNFDMQGFQIVFPSDTVNPLLIK